jgi:PAS domain S-box-containing protein
MEQKPKSSSKYVYSYLLLGILIAIILIGLLFVGMLVYQKQAINLDNLITMFSDNVLFFTYIIILAFFIALIWGVLGYQRDRTEEYRRYADWLSQNQKREIQQAQVGQSQVDKQHQAEISQLNQQMANQKSKFQELEAIIHRGKQQWEATFDAVDDLIILADERGTILRCNRATGETFMLGFSQIIGRGIDELFSTSSDSLLAMNPGEKRDMRLPQSDVWYQISKNHLLIDGKQEGWVYIFRNITSQKQAYRDQQRLTQYYELLVNNSPLAIVTLNQEDRVIDCNPAFENMFQYSKQEAMGAKIDNLIIPEELNFEANSLADAVRKGVKVESITQRRKKDGSLLDVEIFGIPVLLGGKQVGSLGLYHDISNLVKAPKTVPVIETATPEVAEIEEPVTEAMEEQPELVAETTEEPEPVIEPEAISEEYDQNTSSRPKMIPIEKIEGIGPVYARKLLEVGVKTTYDLLDLGKSRKGREEIVEKTGISSLLILKWVNMADLMRIRGIGEEYSELLERAGVDTVKELRNRNPKNLLEAMAQENETHKLVRRLPNLTEVEGWVKEAKESEPLMTY